MKKILIILLLASQIVIGQYTSKIDIINGFEKVKFGTPLSDFKNLVPKVSNEIVYTYTMKDDPILKKYPFIAQVVYVFHKDKLYMITVAAYPGNQFQLLSLANDIYGPSQKDKEDKYFWPGTVNRVNFDIQFNQGALFLYSMEGMKSVIDHEIALKNKQ